MSTEIPGSTLDHFTSFGDLLRFLRRRVSITQVELATAVGYSHAQISRLEQNLRFPDLPTIQARFVAALDLEDEPKAVARLLDLAARVRREDAPASGISPYKGLNYFDEADTDVFAGREALTSRLTERVLALASACGLSRSPRFLAIVGASGSGKSSLVRAGLVPALRWNNPSADWLIHVFTPSAQPLESLAASLTDSVAATAQLRDDLARDPRSLHLFNKRLAQREGAAGLLLVVDQFEELFALCRVEAARKSFIDSLITASAEPDGPTITIIALRADFYAHCAGYVELREALAAQQEYIGGMTETELRQAIEQPAAHGRWELETGLVDLLLQDVGHEPGALPLLSHALLETWQRRRGHTMTLSGYTSSGGVRGAIAETAEAVFTDQFTPEEQAIARRIFVRLTELGEETATGDTRRRATFSELILTPQDADRTRAVLKTLADARLITTGEDTAEVAHEALIREWPRLRTWLEDNREDLRFHRHLTESAQEWSASNREEDLLYRGARLTQAREWAVAHPDEMNDLEREFLYASQAGAEREMAEREAQRERELQGARKLAEEQRRSADRLRGRNRLLRASGAAGLLLLILAGAFGLQSSRNGASAQQNRKHAESLRLAAEASAILSQAGNPGAATLLSIRALQSAYSFQADAALADSLAHLYNRQFYRGHTGWIYSVAFSPDGRFVLTGSQDGTARLWDVGDGKEVRRFIGHRGGVSAVAFSPDGKFVLTGGNDATARLWNASSGEEFRTFIGHSAGLTSVAFSPDGQYVLTAAADTTARLWSSSAGTQIRVFAGHTDLVSGAVFSPDGLHALTGSFDGTTRLWDVETGQTVRTFLAAGAGIPNRPVNSVAFSPDGRLVLGGTEDRKARLWEVASGEESCTLDGHTGAVDSVAFSPDGRYVLTGSRDKTARVWQVQSCDEVREYLGHEGGAKAVAFSPDGQYVLTGSRDDTVRMWAAPASPPLRTFVGSSPESKNLTYAPNGQFESTPPGVHSVAFSSDGKYLLTGGQDSVARLWSVSTGRELRDFKGHAASVASVAFSPDGKYVLTGSDDETVRLWNAERGTQIRLYTGGMGRVATVAFTPDGKYFLETEAGENPFGAGPTVSRQTGIWEVATGRQVRLLHFGLGSYQGSISSILAISADGRSGLVVGTENPGRYDLVASVFDIATGQTRCVLSGHSTHVSSVAFSPDSRFALTGSQDKTARLWDAHSCQQIRLFTDDTSIVTAVAFSPDGRYILTGHDDNKARLWEISSGTELRELQGHTYWITSLAFSPDGKRMVTASQDGTARLWDIDYHDTIKFACSLLWRDLTGDERDRFAIADSRGTCPSP